MTRFISDPTYVEDPIRFVSNHNRIDDPVARRSQNQNVEDPGSDSVSTNPLTGERLWYPMRIHINQRVVPARPVNIKGSFSGCAESEVVCPFGSARWRAVPRGGEWE